MHYLCATNNKVYKYSINSQKNRLHFACIIKSVRFGTNILNYSDKIWES